MKSRAFTLVEILIVISILSLLSSIVVTSVNSGRIKANHTKFLTEMKGLQQALTQYFLDHGSVPTCYNEPGCTMNDQTTAGGLEAVFQPLVDGDYLSYIPHYPGWSPGDGKVSIYYEPPIVDTGLNYIAKMICGQQDYATWNPNETRQQGSFWFINNTGVPLTSITDTYTLCTTQAPYTGCSTYTNSGGGICMDVIGF